MKNTSDIGYQELEKFISEFDGKFHPIAYYDEHLDCIRVQIKDCSFTERRLNKIFTSYLENHVEEDTYVGFSIKGVRHLFEQLGLPIEGVVKLVKIMDAIVKLYRDESFELISEKFKKEFDLSVDFADVAKAA